MTIGERIKARRDELGMSQEELAHKIGYKKQNFHKQDRTWYSGITAIKNKTDC